jgi:flagellar biosynthesis protein
MNLKGKTASAIAYNAEDSAPRLVARGRDREAERIVAIAREAGIPVVEDPVLAVLLDRGVKTGDSIPFWCWELTAKALAFALSKER